MITLILTLAVAGFLCWLVLQIPMPEPFPKVIIGIIILCLILWMLRMFGVYDGGFGSFGRFRGGP